MSVNAVPMLEFLDELVEAHLDTIEMALVVGPDDWSSHVSYLQKLVRVGQEMLAATVRVE